MKKIIAILFITFLLVSCNKVDDANVVKDIDSTNNVVEGKEKQSQKETVTGLIEDLEDFNNIYKKALYNTGKGNKEGIEQTKETLSSWNLIISKYAGNDIESFSKTTDLDSQLMSVEEFIIKANNFVENEKMTEAHEELEMVRKIIFRVRQENGIKNISDDMLMVHDIMETIYESPEDKDIAEFDAIQIWVDSLKVYNEGDEDYAKLVGEFETILNELKELTGEKYKTKLKEIKPAFIKMYLQFG